MKAFPIAIELRSPALVSAAPPASNLLETLRFLPGNTVRGILARRAIDCGLDPNGAEFDRLFLTRQVRYGFAFPESSEPIPLSARTCKLEPGFKPAGHGVADLLLGRSGSCVCGRPLDYLPGFWRPSDQRAAKVATRLITRTAVEPTRGTAKGGQLFSQRVLAEGQVFSAVIEASEEAEERIAELLAEPFPAVVGTGGSRGQGWCEVRSSAAVPSALESARERYRKFTAAAGRPVLAVTLASDGLFSDDYLRDLTAPALAHLAPLGIDPADWSLRSSAFAESRRVFGFDGEPIRLPRSPRLAVSAGSAFLFELAPGRAEPHIAAGTGSGWIGDAHDEGYGRAVLWNPFHLRFAAGGEG